MSQRKELRDLLLRGYRYALSLTHQPATAEDIVQDAWVSILSAQGPRTLRYLFCAIRSRVYDRWRREQWVVLEEYASDCTAEDSYELDRSVEGLFARDELKHILGQLRTQEREVLFLMSVEGYTAQEVADLTQRSRGTILSLLHRTKKKCVHLLRVQASTSVQLQEQKIQ